MSGMGINYNPQAMSQFINNPLLNFGLNMLSAGIPSPNPQSGSLSYGISQGLAGARQAGQEQLKQQQAQLQQQQSELLLQQLTNRMEAAQALKKYLNTGDQQALVEAISNDPTLSREVVMQQMQPEKPEKPSAFAEKLQLMGYQPGTPEYMDMAKRLALRPSTSTNIYMPGKPPNVPTGFVPVPDPNEPSGWKQMRIGGYEYPTTEAGKRAATSIGYEAVNHVANNILEYGEEGDFKGINKTLYYEMAFGIPFTRGGDLRRILGQALDTKMRSETGAAARPDERDEILSRYLPKTGTEKGIEQGFKMLRDWFTQSLKDTNPTFYKKLRARGDRENGKVKPWEINR